MGFNWILFFLMPLRQIHGGRSLWEAKDNRKWGHDKYEEITLHEKHYEEVIIFKVLCGQAFLFVQLSFFWHSCLKFRGGLLRVIIAAEVKVEALITEDMFEETGQDIMTVAIKIRCLRGLWEGEAPKSMNVPIKAMRHLPKCKINSKYRLHFLKFAGHMI